MDVLKPAAEFDYSPRVRELFGNLSHAGTLPDASVTAAAGLSAQGATIILQLKVIENVMRTVRYHAYGCPHFLAACESLACWLEGRPVSEMAQWNWRDVAAVLQVPIGKRARLLLLEDAVKEIQSRLG